MEDVQYTMTLTMSLPNFINFLVDGETGFQPFCSGFRFSERCPREVKRAGLAIERVAKRQ